MTVILHALLGLTRYIIHTVVDYLPYSYVCSSRVSHKPLPTVQILHHETAIGD